MVCVQERVWWSRFRALKMEHFRAAYVPSTTSGGRVLFCKWGMKGNTASPPTAGQASGLSAFYSFICPGGWGGILSPRAGSLTYYIHICNVTLTIYKMPPVVKLWHNTVLTEPSHLLWQDLQWLSEKGELKENPYNLNIYGNFPTCSIFKLGNRHIYVVTSPYLFEVQHFPGNRKSSLPLADGQLLRMVCYFFPGIANAHVNCLQM